MNSAVAEVAAARADAVLPLQVDMADLVGLPEVARATIERRQGGRPPGARNKRLDEIARLVRERFGDVLVQQLAIATMPVEDLVAAGLSVEKAFEERRLSAAVVLPYIEQRQAVRVDVTNRQVVSLTIVEGAFEGEQDQGLIEAVVVQSDSTQSDAGATALIPLADPSPGQLITDQQAATPLPAPGEGGGPVFRPGLLRRAPAGVVNPAARNFRANLDNPRAEGSGA